MKARIRKTGEVVDIISYSGSTTRNDVLDNVSYIDNNGDEHPNVRNLNLYWDFEIIDDNTENKVAPHDIDWKQRRYEIAKAVLQGIWADSSIHHTKYDTIHSEDYSIFASKAIMQADALIEELKKNSTFECTKFKKKLLTYEDVAKKLFFKSACYSTNGQASIERYATAGSYYGDLNNATSEKQLKKLLAINKLLNTSVFLNNGWKPDWSNDTEYKYHIAITDEGHICINDISTFNGSFCYFKSEKLAQQAIDILGEDTIRLALSTDW